MAVTAPTHAQLQQRHAHTWQIIDWYGGWVAVRLHRWSAAAERHGIVNVLGADTLEELAGKLDEQTRAEALRRGRPLPGS